MSYPSNRPRKGGYIRPQSCICSVVYASSPDPKKWLTGTGAFYNLEYPEGTFRTLFITSFHVAPLNNSNEVINIKLVFEDKSIGNVNLTPDWVKFLWTSPTEEMDVTIVELSTIAIKVLSRTNYYRLPYASPKKGDEVAVFQYPGGEMKVGNGYIETEGRVLEYIVETEAGSSGSPLLDKNFNVVGIHCGVWQIDEKFENKRKAMNILVIMEAYKTALRNLSKGKNENDKWIEMINQIPKNELQLIGSGGYGKVYLTKDPQNKSTTESQIVLKIIEGFGGLDTYKKQVEELKKEYETVQNLRSSSNIIRLFAYVRDDQNAKLILIMEYLEGRSLADKIKKNNNCGLEKSICLNYMEQISEGIIFLHSKNVFHGDIKPANILFTNNDKIKLCDIGLAVHLQFASSATAAHLRKDCYYMSPERINGTTRSAENDIWSIGATFVVMITGQTINPKDKFPKINMNISQYNIFIGDDSLEVYIAKLKESDFIRLILSNTLCPIGQRANAEKLNEIVKQCQSALPKMERAAQQAQDQDTTKSVSFSPKSNT